MASRSLTVFPDKNVFTLFLDMLQFNQKEKARVATFKGKVKLIQKTGKGEPLLYAESSSVSFNQGSVSCVCCLF